jgi:uridine kinase
VGEQRIEAHEIVVVEGLHALHAVARAHVDIAVFVEAPRDARWARAVAREKAGDETVRDVTNSVPGLSTLM